MNSYCMVMYEGIMLDDMLFLIWSYRSFVSQYEVCEPISDYEIGHNMVMMIGGSLKSFRCLSIVRHLVGKPFWRMILHCARMGLIETISL